LHARRLHVIQYLFLLLLAIADDRLDIHANERPLRRRRRGGKLQQGPGQEAQYNKLHS
jgi:hypothetical protein